jgi:uroporphyrin-III C-methyltransferase/precorrin-2 dehydrogenase/sirohydrochlorin ferrochelatase
VKIPGFFFVVHMFPAFLNLSLRRVVVVGGGPVAASKLDALLLAGAEVMVVAPDVVPDIERRPVTVVRRPFEDADLDGAWWVVAAAPSDVNRRVRAAADARRIFVNAVDDPRHATAYLGGVVRRDGVTVAISTDGRAPALSGLLREAVDAWLPGDLQEWLAAADAARQTWKQQRVPMEQRRPQLLAVLNKLYDEEPGSGIGDRGSAAIACARSDGMPADPVVPIHSDPGSRIPDPGFVSLVGAGPGDPSLWTVRAVRSLEQADLVLYDALVDSDALRRVTRAQCFCVGKRARRDSVPQETIHRLMIRAAGRGKRVVRLKGGDPFVFGRGGEEALALAMAGISFEVIPGVTTAVAVPELAGIPVTHRGLASGFLVLAGHTSAQVHDTLTAVRPNSVSIVILMGLGARRELGSQLIAHGWSPATPAAIVCDGSTPHEWTWTGSLEHMGDAEAPQGAAGVLVVGEVVKIREALVRAGAFNKASGPESASTRSAEAPHTLSDGKGQSEPNEVKYGRH